MELLVNIDVPDLARAVTFYTEGFGLAVTRRFGVGVAELSGWPVRLYLLEKPGGSLGAGTSRRSYERHWTPVHLDVVVGDLEASLARAQSAGAQAETEIRNTSWGKIVGVSDPFGHGLCLIEFRGRGYDEIAEPAETTR
jgi:predicted enzyme related to lactoylglutathione lyase